MIATHANNGGRVGRFNSLPKWFVETDGGKAALAEAEAQWRTERQEIQEELDRLKSGMAQAVPQAQAEVERARSVALESGALHRRNLEALAEAESRLRRASTGPEHRIAQLETQLRASADPRIDAFLIELQEEQERLRDTADLIERVEYGKPDRQGKRQRVSNMPSINARILAVVDAMRAADRLKVQIGDDVEERLEELRASLPPIEPAESFVPQDA